MKIWGLIFLLTSFQVLAGIESTELSGNVEAQARQSWNNPQADVLFQDWDQAEFYLLYGNLNGKIDFGNSKLESNLFARYTQSELYQNPLYVAPQIFTFPRKLVARNLFKLEHRKQYDNHTEEAILNNFSYQFNYKDHRFAVGRIYINYGLGEIFNPINPFNQPTGLTSISQVAQGNDGGLFSFYASEKHTMDFYVLVDKNLSGHENKISKTLWVHGEYQATEKLQLDYVLGEDQRRYKAGGQASYRFEEAMAFFQTLYQSDFINNDPSSNLWDAMIGVDQQMTGKWHVRIESGYQKQNKYASVINFGDRFLPSEYFLALANVYEVHPLVKLSGTLINDVKSGFMYGIGRSTFSLGSNTEAEIFFYTPLAKGDAVDNPTQKLVTSDLGLALRSFF